MSDAGPSVRASKIRRFGPLASAANRNLQRDGSKGPLDKLSNQGQHASPLSTEVQRSLLHVGMRVRKSVLNGYKTGLEGLEQALESQSANGVKPASPIASQMGFLETQTLTSGRNPTHSISSHSPASTITGRKKRPLDDHIEDVRLSLTDTAMSFEPSLTPLPDCIEGKTRRFAIPRSRKSNSGGAAQPMDLDPFIFTDERGDWVDADFLMPE